MSYSLAALHKYREQKRGAAGQPASMAVLDVVQVDEKPEQEHLHSSDIEVVTAKCQKARVWIVRDGGRWLLYSGTRRARGKQEMATPFLAHAIRTAEEWYGAPADGWCAEKKR